LDERSKKDAGNFGYTKSFHSFAPSLYKYMDVKERILQKATQLYMQYSVRSVTMDDIAEQSGVSKKTIYQFFADKDELVQAVFLAEINESETCCNMDRYASANAIEEVFKAMEMVERMFRSMNPSLLYDVQKYHPSAYVHFEKHKNEYLHTVIRDNLERGIAEGFYREDFNVDIITRFRLESMMLPFNPSFRTARSYDLADLEIELTLHFLYGIVNPKGYKLILKYQDERNKTTLKDEKKLVK
jgi:TetR/AcrR family transcriptional regulator, cholesterol catabolism regulator